MKAKKVISSEKMNSVSAPVHAQPVLNGSPVHGMSTTFIQVKPMTANERHIYELNCSILKEETSKANIQAIASFGFDNASFTPLAWYESLQASIHELRLARETARLEKLGLLKSIVPSTWQEHASSKDKFTASLFAWLCSLAREFKLDDVYQIDLEDCLDDLPSYDRHGKVSSKTDKAKHYHIVWSKARSALLPLVDRYTGVILRAGCPECRIQIERIAKTDSYQVSFF